MTASARPKPPPQFFIERTDLRNAGRVSPDVVIVESRMPTGRTCSQQELREASDRVNRLPYLLSAGCSLEKGTNPCRSSTFCRESKRNDSALLLQGQVRQFRSS